MALSHPFQVPNHRAGRSYLRAPVPLHFPSEEEVPEGIELGPILRLARDATGGALVLTAEERVAELEAELQKRA